MKIPLRILTIFLTLLVTGFGSLALTGCTGDVILWAEIYVFNESDFEIRVSINQREYYGTSETGVSSSDREVKSESIKPNGSTRYNGDSDYYHIKINANGNTWYYPGIKYVDYIDVERMEEEVELIFDGETITKGKGKK